MRYESEVYGLTCLDKIYFSTNSLAITRRQSDKMTLNTDLDVYRFEQKLPAQASILNLIFLI